MSLDLGGPMLTRWKEDNWGKWYLETRFGLILGGSMHICEGNSMGEALSRF